MAGSKSQSAAGKKKKQHGEAAAADGELGRVQKRATAAWTMELSELVKFAGELCKGSQLEWLAGLYLLVRRSPDVIKALKEKEKEKDKAKLIKLESKIKDLLKQQLPQALQQLSSTAAEAAAAAAAADMRRPSLVLAWAVSGALKEFPLEESRAQQQEAMGALQPYMDSHTELEDWLKQWADPAAEFPAAEQDELGKQAGQQLRAVLGNSVLQWYCSALVRVTGARPPTHVYDNYKTLQKQVETTTKEAAAAASNEQLVRQQLERKPSPTPYNQQQQQQQGKRGKDEKAQDAKRGRAGDDSAALELQQAKAALSSTSAQAADVVKCLSGTIVGPKGSIKDHLAKLSDKVLINPDKVKETLSSLSAKAGPAGKAAKDSKAAADGKAAESLDLKLASIITQRVKEQFGVPQPPDQQLQSQLTQALEGSWMLFCDTTAVDGHKSGTGGKLPHVFSSLADFKTHVELNQLSDDVAKDLVEKMGMRCSNMGPGLMDAYNMDFGDLLDDEAVKALMPSRKDKGGVTNGLNLEDNPVLRTFAEDCPLRRYLFYSQRTHTGFGDEAPVVSGTLPGLDLDSLYAQGRSSTSNGFALLQLQRGKVAVTPEELSYAPDWVIKAYQCLKLLLPASTSAVHPEQLDYVAYYYFAEGPPEAIRDVKHMLDPEAYAQEVAAAGATGKPGSSSSSSQEYTFSDGLVEDSITMLQMLHDAQALVVGPLQLALQVYSHKLVGCALPLPHKQGSQLNRKELSQVLSSLERGALLELRSFLLQVLPQHFARMSKYLDFLQDVIDKRWKRRYMPVVSSGKKLVVAPDFYEQACMSAAVPYAQNAPCCSKHVRMRELAEAEGRVFSKDTVEDAAHYACSPDLQLQLNLNERVTSMQRYLLQPARVEQAVQEQKLQVGTEKGLQALTMELLHPSQYDDAVPQRQTTIVKPPAHWGWGLGRFLLLLASQLAIHRQQLYHIIKAHEERLAQGWWNVDSYRDHDMKYAETALMQQRIAGLVFCYDAWAKWYQQARTQLSDRMEEVNNKLKVGKEGADKGAKGAKEAMNAQQTKELNAELTELHSSIEKADKVAAGITELSRFMLQQADMSASQAEALDTSVVDADAGLANTLHLLIGELLNPRPAPESFKEERLRTALSLSRRMLFELDVTSFSYVSHAHILVLANMWRFRQPAAAVSLVRHALGLHMVNLVHELNVSALIEDEEAVKASSSKATAGKAAGKKKKKKGAAQPQKKQIWASADSDEHDSEQEQAEAAVAAAESEPEDAADAQANGEPDMASLINLKFLQMDQEQPAPATTSSSSSSSRAAATQVAAAAAAQAKPAKAGAAGADQKQPLARTPQQQQQGKGRGASTSSRSSSSRQHPRASYYDGPRGPVVGMSERGAVCCECGETGHTPSECTVPYCESCRKYGHPQGRCRDACRDCGRLHPGGCNNLCGFCRRNGHIQRFCPDTCCHSCKRWGHASRDCPKCFKCGNDHPLEGRCQKCCQQGHETAQCKAFQCPTCSQWDRGCVVGNCLNEEATAAATRSSSSKAVVPPQQQQLGRRGGAQPAGAAPAAAAAPAPGGAPAAVVLPSNVKLLAPQQAGRGDRKQQFAAELFNVEGLDIQSFAAELVGDEEKMNLLLRVPEEVMATWLKQPEPLHYLKGMLDHIAATRQGSSRQQAQQQQQQQAQQPRFRPCDLPPEAVHMFESTLGPDAAAQLPAGWRGHTSWREVEARMSSSRGRAKDRFRQAKRAATDMAAAAAGFGGDVRTARSGSDAAAHHQQQQQQRGDGEPSGPRDSFASYDESEGGRFAAHEDAPMPGMPHSSMQQAPQQPPSQQDGLHAQMQQQQQQQPADGMAAAAGPAPAGALAAVLHSRIRQGTPGGTAPPQAAQQQPLPGHQLPGGYQPPAGSNSYAIPHSELALQQQQQPQTYDEGEQRVLEHHGPLEPWMLWHKAGAFRAIEENVVADPQLHKAMMTAASGSGNTVPVQQLAEILQPALVAMREMKHGHVVPVGYDGMRTLGALLMQARDAGPPHYMQEQQQQQQPPRPGPGAPAVSATMLPPHLRHTIGLQQQQPGMPPHLQASYQQQLPAVVQPADDSESEDEGIMLESLIVTESASQQQQPAADAAPTSWAAVTGHPMDEDSSSHAADYPPLGATAGAAAMDVDMERALAASRADQPQPSNVPGVSVAGLANQAGEYNCFLNVVVQCLWSCKQFTQQVRQMAMHETEHPVVAALLRLFSQMEAAETGWKPGHERAVINPSELRVALASHTPFQCQEMNDANELLDTIYECFKQAQHDGKHQGSRGITVDGVFGLLLTEKVVCRRCSKETHKVPMHYEHLIVVNSASLNLAALSLEGAGMDRMLAFLFAQEHKYCDKDEGGCGEPNPRFRELVMGPQVLTLQLVWDQQVSAQDIRETLANVQEDLDITAMYDVMQVASTTFRLSSAVAYYGQHYMAFVFNSKLNTWLMFDDASVSAVGSWQDVITKCGAGRIQPGVLFYQLVDLAALPDQPAAPRAAAAAPPPVVAVHMAGNGSTSSSSTGGMYGAPAMHSAPPSAVAAPAAAAAAPAAGPQSALPSRSTWGAGHSHAAPRAAPQQSLDGSTGGYDAASGMEVDSFIAGGPTPAESDTWVAAPSSSGSFTSSSGPAAASAGAPHSALVHSRGSGEGWNATASSTSGSGSHHSRPAPAATGPGAAAGAGNWPAGQMSAAALRDLQRQGGAPSTGPRAGSSGVASRYTGSGGPGGGPMERSGSGGAFGGRGGGGDIMPGRGRGGGGGRSGLGGPGRGGLEPEGWDSTPGRGRGRGPAAAEDWQEGGQGGRYNRGGKSGRP